MFTLFGPISRTSDVDLEDQAKVKFALTALGYHDDSEEGLSPYSSDKFFDNIKRYQKDKGLKIDGVINPDRETHKSLRSSLGSDEKTGSAFGDLWRNYEDMKKFPGLDGADKYFHCKANYESSSRGWGGAVAGDLVDFKELKDVFKHGIKDSMKDIRANHHGQDAARSGKYKSAQDACEIFRVDGIGEEY